MKNNEIKYYVRKSWEDIESQAGIDYNFLINAKKACDKLEGYYVFDSEGRQVYPEIIEKEKDTLNDEFKVGDEILLSPEAIYVSGKPVAKELLEEKLYINKINENICTISKRPNKLILGQIDKSYIYPYQKNGISIMQPYFIRVEKDNTSLYKNPSNDYIIKKLNKYNLYTIINEKNGFGKIKVGPGWIKLDEVLKL